ncbi:hypothetical protein HU200_065331 [Digitaria exilis]|uniref:Uncharacterized protein n=1 Tax=Digitaria exilis TaxID=1010633 RepID=A0A835A350_9POAL|nr:hypothetical protein HU200_065331 [Digitaria exilis]
MQTQTSIRSSTTTSIHHLAPSLARGPARPDPAKPRGTKRVGLTPPPASRTATRARFSVADLSLRVSRVLVACVAALDRSLQAKEPQKTEYPPGSTVQRAFRPFPPTAPPTVDAVHACRGVIRPSGPTSQPFGPPRRGGGYEQTAEDPMRRCLPGPRAAPTGRVQVRGSCLNCKLDSAEERERQRVGELFPSLPSLPFFFFSLSCSSPPTSFPAPARSRSRFASPPSSSSSIPSLPPPPTDSRIKTLLRPAAARHGRRLLQPPPPPAAAAGLPPLPRAAARPAGHGSSQGPAVPLPVAHPHLLLQAPRRREAPDPSPCCSSSRSRASCSPLGCSGSAPSAAASASLPASAASWFDAPASGSKSGGGGGTHTHAQGTGESIKLRGWFPLLFALDVAIYC